MRKAKPKVLVPEIEDTELAYVEPGRDPQTGRALPFWTKRRGPYRLVVERPFVTKPGFYRLEWLPGEVAGEDVEAEALALLTDPRDTINNVAVWSLYDEQFVMSYERGPNGRKP